MVNMAAGNATYTVTFNPGSGSLATTSSQTDTSGKLSALPTPTNSGGYRFDGWFTASSGGTRITVDTVFTQDTTIYAQWTNMGGSGSGGGGGTVTIVADGKTEEVPEETPEETPEEVPGNASEWINPFTDVSPSDYFYDDIVFAVQNGLFQGNNGSFSPQSPLTRGMLVTVLWRLEGTPETGFHDAGFPDLRTGAYYETAVDWALENGIITGYGDGTFRPESIISRQQFAAILYRYAKAQAALGELPFYDDAQISGYAKDGVLWCNQNGIINGKPNGNFDP
jgi:uncharacterized repeat protein (TIGR02543 family)